MNKAHFDKMFHDFIQRDEEQITPDLFFQILAEIEQEHVERTVELRAKVVGGKLRFEPSPEVFVHENEIVWGNQRIVVQVL
jgi:hypothetical protein